MRTATQPTRGYPIKCVNEIMGTVHYVYNGQSRGEIIEGFLFGANRSARICEDDPCGASDSEPFNAVVQITEDAITLRFYADDDLEAAKEAMARCFPEFAGEGGPAA